MAFEKICCRPAGRVVVALPLPDSKAAEYSKVILAVVEPRFVNVSSVVKKELFSPATESTMGTKRENVWAVPPAPVWVTVKVWPPIVRLAERELLPVLAATE